LKRKVQKTFHGENYGEGGEIGTCVCAPGLINSVNFIEIRQNLMDLVPANFKIDNFSKMTSFSLLNFKFTQIFLMGQNGFSKMTELSVNSTEFQFFGRLLFLSHVKHDSTKF
jgi:hypothetical protein